MDLTIGSDIPRRRPCGPISMGWVHIVPPAEGSQTAKRFPSGDTDPGKIPEFKSASRFGVPLPSACTA